MKICAKLVRMDNKKYKKWGDGKIDISQHAAQRYAERIAGRDTKIDINIFVQQNIERIEDNINAMLNNADLIYRGKLGKRNNTTDVYLSNTWVLLVDPSKSKVVTLYKIDLGVGEEFNRDYAQKSLEKINLHKQELEAAKTDVAEQKETYQKLIAEYEDQISEYRDAIRKLEQLKTDYQDIVKELDTNCIAAELAIKHDVENLVSNRTGVIED